MFHCTNLYLKGWPSNNLKDTVIRAFLLVSILTHISLIRYHVHSTQLPLSALQKGDPTKKKNRTPNNRPLSHSLCVFEHMSLSARSRLHWCSFSCGSRDHLLLAYPCKKPAQLKHLCLLDGFVVSGFPIYIYVYAQVPFSERGWSLMEDAGDAAQETNIRLEPVSSPIEHVSQQLLFSGVPHDHPHRQPENYYPQAKTVKKMNLWLDRFTLETSSQSA